MRTMIGACVSQTSVSSLISVLSHAEIDAPDPIVREQAIMRTFEHHAAGLQNIAEIAGLHRLRHALLNQENGESAVAMKLANAFEDQVGDCGRESHRRLVQHEHAWRG